MTYNHGTAAFIFMIPHQGDMEESNAFHSLLQGKLENIFFRKNIQGDPKNRTHILNFINGYKISGNLLGFAFKMKVCHKNMQQRFSRDSQLLTTLSK